MGSAAVERVPEAAGTEAAARRASVRGAIARSDVQQKVISDNGVLDLQGAHD